MSALYMAADVQAALVICLVLAPDFLRLHILVLKLLTFCSLCLTTNAVLRLPPPAPVPSSLADVAGLSMRVAVFFATCLASLSDEAVTVHLVTETCNLSLS